MPSHIITGSLLSKKLFQWRGEQNWNSRACQYGCAAASNPLNGIFDPLSPSAFLSKENGESRGSPSFDVLFKRRQVRTSVSGQRHGIDGTRCRSTPFEPHRPERSTSTVSVTGHLTASGTVPGSAPYGCIFDIITMESTDPAPTQNSGHKVRRPRAARACNLCRLKKNKCDELYPCTYCRSTSILRHVGSLLQKADRWPQIEMSSAFTKGKIRPGGGTLRSMSSHAHFVPA